MEISSEIADSEHAIILDQVENGVATRMAVMYLLANESAMFEVEKLESIDVIVPHQVGAIALFAKNLNDYTNNVIIDLRENIILLEDDFDALESIANNRFELQKSLALCNVIGEKKSIIEKRFDDDIIVVPTMNEAVDFVYMEEQERELGL